MLAICRRFRTGPTTPPENSGRDIPVPRLLGSGGRRRSGLLRGGHRADDAGIVLVLSVETVEFFLASQVGICRLLAGHAS